MRATFSGQPFPQWTPLGRWLRDELPTARRFWAATAWAKRSGLSRIATAIGALRTNGGNCELIVGLDANGATAEGLRLALELFDRAFVFHNPGRQGFAGDRTFHPKLCVVERDESATVFIGSSNLTKGGLFTNFEASVRLDIDRGEHDDVAFLDEIRRYYEHLRDADSACQRLTPELLEQLLQDERIPIGSESARNRAHAERSAGDGRASVFGAPLAGLGSAPEPDTTPAARDEEDTDAVQEEHEPVIAEGPSGGTVEAHETEEDDEGREGEPVAEGALVVPAGTTAATPQGTAGASFFKALSRNDVSLGSSPGQIVIPIRFRSFFEPLELETDESATGGPRQSQRYFPVMFRDGSFRKGVEARVILYEPAADHPRLNIELRFTFRDREILERLRHDDQLVFSKDGEVVVVDRVAPGARGPGRFGWL